mmetsp:Transcript_35764/g.77180  ORF Transcript_35764/g.77180 Transcript_35764/m.77180 type:complete len:275 (-) Transcript_35764:25-849(-)
MSRIGTAFERAVSSAVSPRTPEPYVPSVTLKLNVGGAKFTTTYSTVRNIDGMLSAMFSGRYSLSPGADGYHFIDRDGTHFRHILNLLRFPTEFNISLSKGDLQELEIEVRYYKLGEAYTLAREILTPTITAQAMGYQGDEFKANFTVGSMVLSGSNRGWNVLLFDPLNNTVISQTCYDTARDVTAIQRLADLLHAAPQGTILAIAVIDFGNISHGLELPMALNCYGCEFVGFKAPASFAMVGRKGFGPRLAAEASDEGGAVVTATRVASKSNRW